MIHKLSRLLMTLVALFAMTAGAWAGKAEPTIYTSPVDVSKLKTGDFLVKGFSLNSSANNDMIWFSSNRVKISNTVQTSMSSIPVLDISAYSGNDATFTCYNNTYAPIDENGNVGNAWKVASGYHYDNNNGYYVVELQGVTIDLPVIVDWDPATKKGTFDMPGYDLTLTPVYAPAARFVDDSEKPTVATDEIFVGAQTKLITEGTQLAQGTMRYAVSESNTTKPALSAFSATVPTGQSVSASGDWYVWYYIAGADTPTGQTPTAENTFNDSEIFAEPIKATVSAPPTFALDLAINADDKADWTMVKPQVDLQALDPLTVDVDPGAEVELKYNGQKRVRTVIVKPRVTFVAPVGKTDLTYNGTKTADATEQELIRANTGTVTGGTIYYSVCYHKVGETEFGEWSEWSTEKPKGINAGEYKIKYKIVPNKRYVGGVEESEEAVTTASIAKADGWVTLNSYSSTGWQVTTERQVVVTITGNHGGLLSALAFFGVENIYSASLNNTTVTITKPSSSIYNGEPAKVIITCAATDNFKDATATYTCRQ